MAASVVMSFPEITPTAASRFILTHIYASPEHGYIYYVQSVYLLLLP
jgi:hypothetical protein